MQKALKFLESHNMLASQIEIDNLVELFLHEMEAGLKGEKSSLLMIPTYIEADNQLKLNQPVIAIDAGGTNFRTAKIFFNEKRELVIENLQNFSMPAIEREYTKEEFFKTIAGYLRDYIDVSDKIGFCFSYAVEIFPDKDGKLIEWSKEIRAPEVIGEKIGKNLLEAMGCPGKKVVLLNDTVATLLAGKAATSGNKSDTFIGFILGTGTNTAYIEQNVNITKIHSLDKHKSQIINIESGNFDKAPRSDIDLMFDNQTKNPGRYSFEKMFSGGYFGGLCTAVLKAAANEGLFTNSVKNQILTLPELSSQEVNNFVLESGNKPGILAGILKVDGDRELVVRMIEELISRAAKLVAANLAAVILKTGLAKNPERPVCLTIDGTTFYRLKNFQRMFELYLKQYLRGDKQRYYQIVTVGQSSLAGAAIAGIVN